MKALKIAGFMAAALLAIAIAAAAYWYVAVYSSSPAQLVRACEAAIQNDAYVPDSTKFRFASVNPQPVDSRLRMLKLDMEIEDVVDATKQLTTAKALAASRSGEVLVAFTSKNRMGVPLPGNAACTYSAAPAKSLGERLASVVVSSMETATGGQTPGWLAKLRYRWLLAQQPIEQTAQPSPIPSDAIHPKWSYFKVSIGQTAPRWAADLQSANVIALASPYDQPQTARLDLYRIAPFWQATIRLDHGQFSCDDDCVVLVRFDGKLQIFHGSSGRTGDSAYLDMSIDSSKFVAAMLKARRVEIMLPIFDNGYVASDFDVGGFDHAKFEDDNVGVSSGG